MKRTFYHILPVLMSVCLSINLMASAGVDTCLSKETRTSDPYQKMSIKRACLNRVDSFDDFYVLAQPTCKKSECKGYWQDLQGFIVEMAPHYVGNPFYTKINNVDKIIHLGCLVSNPVLRTRVYALGIPEVRSLDDFLLLTKSDRNLSYQGESLCRSSDFNEQKEISRAMAVFYKDYESAIQYLTSEYKPENPVAALMQLRTSLEDLRRFYPQIFSKALEEILIATASLQLSEVDTPSYEKEISAYSNYIGELAIYWEGSKPVSMYFGRIIAAVEYFEQHNSSSFKVSVLSEAKALRSFMDSLEIYLPDYLLARQRVSKNNLNKFIRYYEASNNFERSKTFYRDFETGFIDKVEGSESLLEEIKKLDEKFSVSSAKHKELSIISNSLLISIEKLKATVGGFDEK